MNGLGMQPSQGGALDPLSQLIMLLHGMAFMSSLGGGGSQTGQGAPSGLSGLGGGSLGGSSAGAGFSPVIGMSTPGRL